MNTHARIIIVSSAIVYTHARQRAALHHAHVNTRARVIIVSSVIIDTHARQRAALSLLSLSLSSTPTRGTQHVALDRRAHRITSQHVHDQHVTTVTIISERHPTLRPRHTHDSTATTMGGDRYGATVRTEGAHASDHQHLHATPPSVFGEAYTRGQWLLALLILQSTSSVVLQNYETLIKENLVITLFLTMLVGAG